MCNGTYIKIGAPDRVRYSNLHVFHHYFLWKGVQIEMIPDRYKELIVNQTNKIVVVNSGVWNE